MKTFLSLDCKSQHKDIINSLGSCEWISKNLFKGSELQYAKYLSQKSVNECISQQLTLNWSEQLEAEFLVVMSRSMLSQEYNDLATQIFASTSDENGKERRNKLLLDFLQANCVQQHIACYEKLKFEVISSIELLQSVRIFKENLLKCNELILDKKDLCSLINTIQTIKTKKPGIY